MEGQLSLYNVCYIHFKFLKGQKVNIIFSAYSQSDSKLDPRIINGITAPVSRTKFQVSIRLKIYDRIFGNGHICGGSLIGPNKVVTAAHCLYE